MYIFYVLSIFLVELSSCSDEDCDSDDSENVRDLR